jgi:hypothetical protein
MILVHVTVFSRRSNQHSPKCQIYLRCKVSIQYFSRWLHFRASANEVRLTKKYLLL